MTPPLALDAGLALLVLAVAAWTIAARRTFASVIGFVTYGLLLALAWVRLSAVDVALTEATIGGGVTGVLLLAASARLRQAERAPDRAKHPAPALRVMTAILSAVVAAGLAAVVLVPVSPAPTLAPPAIANLPATGLGNPVAAVLLAYRAWDTLLEKVVLLLALLGVWSLAPDLLWGGRPGARHFLRQDSPLTLLAQLLPPVGIVVGVYLVWNGATAPGGAFPGGTILAAMWILVMQAGLADAPAVSGRAIRIILVAGAALFLAVGLAGFVVADAFLAYPAAYAKPLIVAIEIPLTLSIAATLGLLVVGPPARKPEA